jgi:hypothetical protein
VHETDDRTAIPTTCVGVRSPGSLATWHCSDSAPCARCSTAVSVREMSSLAWASEVRRSVVGVVLLLWSLVGGVGLVPRRVALRVMDHSALQAVDHLPRRCEGFRQLPLAQRHHLSSQVGRGRVLGL